MATPPSTPCRPHRGAAAPSLRLSPAFEEGVPQITGPSLTRTPVAGDPLIAINALSSPGQGRQASGGRDTLSLAIGADDPPVRLDAAGMQRVVASLVVDGCEITSVDLAGNSIGPEGARQLAGALREVERKISARAAPAAAAAAAPGAGAGEGSGEKSAAEIVAAMKAKKKAAGQPEPEPLLIIHFVHLQNRMPTTRRYSCDFVLTPPVSQEHEQAAHRAQRANHSHHHLHVLTAIRVGAE
jgi:hypothetical protein